MIRSENLSISFGKRILLEKESFTMQRGEKIGLAGRNGSGKSTLLSLIAGEREPDSGKIIIPKNYTVAYMKQKLSFTHDNLIDECASCLPEDCRHEEYQAKKILSGLGFYDSDFLRSPAEFSGGFQVRIELAKALVSGRNLLLLDEPTNYLDLPSTTWLADYLESWPGEFILVTHDRSFMDRVVTHVMLIHRARMRKTPGNTQKMYEQIALEEEVYEKTRINDEKKRREVEIFISRFRAKARLANLVQSRIRALEKTQKAQKLEKIENAEFDFPYKAPEARYLLSARNLLFHYQPGNELIGGLDLDIQKNEKICIIGKNGKGKTTLLRLLAGELSPSAGTVKKHEQCLIGYFGQTNINRLHPQNTVLSEVQQSAPHLPARVIRTMLGNLLFTGEDSDKKISILSGGERARVLLGKILVTPNSLLFLDEPTNHLDMESCDSLLEALINFEGAVVMVTHNELFLNSLPDRLIVFQPEGPEIFYGSYQEFLANGGFREEDKLKQKKNKKPEINRPEKTGKECKKTELALVKQEIRRLEEILENLEKSLKTSENMIIEYAARGESFKISELSILLASQKKEADENYSRLEMLLLRQEEIEEKYR